MENAEVLEMTVKRVEGILQNQAQGNLYVHLSVSLSKSFTCVQIILLKLYFR